jgi:hypothetical protein
MQETVSSLKEPVGIVFSEELGGLAKESTESDGQGASNSSFVPLHLVFVGSRIRRKSFVEICVVVVVVVDLLLCSDF